MSPMNVTEPTESPSMLQTRQTLLGLTLLNMDPHQTGLVISHLLNTHSLPSVSHALSLIFAESFVLLSLISR